MNVSLKRRMLDAVGAVRKKFADFKRNKAEAQLAYHTTHEQIIQPLQNIESAIKANNQYVKKKKINIKKENELMPEIKQEPEDADYYDDYYNAANANDYDENYDAIDYADDIENHEKSYDDDDYDELEESDAEEVTNEEKLKTYNALPQFYAKLLSAKKADAPEVDRSRYGMRYDISRNKWKIGNTNVRIVGNNIEVDGKKYKGTRGLYDLLTLKTKPASYKIQDVRNFIAIIIRTNAHRVRYSPKNKVATSHFSWKYRNLIEPYVRKKNKSRSSSSKKKKSHSSGGKLKSKKKTQRTFKVFNSKPVEYVYWDDLNELVQRLRLLHSSKLAGNNSKQNRNEIHSIIVELKEAGIIA